VARSEFTVVHSIRGRLRVRLPLEARTAGLAEVIRALPGVTEATWNEQTRGLFVRYLDAEVGPDTIIDAVASHARIPALGHAAANGGPQPLAATVASAVGRLDERVSRTTRGQLDLGLLVPIALTVWAIRDVLRPRVAPLSWSSALWYAHGLFRDYALRKRA